MTISEIKYSRKESFTFVIVAYIIAIAAPILMLPYLSRFHDLIQVGIIDVVATVIIFIFSVRLNNSSMYDPYWSVIPIPIVFYFMSLFPEGNIERQLAICFLVSFWGIRLTFNWVRGWPGLHHEDWRYTDLKDQNGKAYWAVSFSGIHLFPTILVFMGLVPTYYAMKLTDPIGIIDIAAIVVTFGAVLIELISDEQLRNFRKSQEFKSGKLIARGLWKHSRHPNYFGEVMFWVGLSIFGLHFDLNSFWWLFAGAISMILLFVFISIPMMEKRSIKLRPNYKDYQQKVSMLVPWFSKLKD